MRAREIRKGDEYAHNDEIVYVVLDVEQEQAEVHATVRFRDGGTGTRVFPVGAEVPLTRPRGN